MNQSPFILIGSILIAIAAGCTTKHIAYPASAKITPYQKADSIPIWLPRTVLEFKCLGVVKIQEPSPLFLRAKDPSSGAGEKLSDVMERAKEFGLEVNVREVTNFTYSIKEPSLTARGERDPEALFYVRMEGGLFTKTEFSSQLAPDGVPGAISSSAENKGFEFAMKAVEVAAGIAAKAVGMGLMNLTERRTGTEDSQKPLLERVSLQIRALRKARQDLITGQTLVAPVDEKTLVRMLEEIKQAEEALTANFTGSITVKGVPLVVAIRPASTYRGEYRLLRFDKTKGFLEVDADDSIRISPIPGEVRATESFADSYVALRMTQQSPAENSMWANLGEARASERGLPFRVPATSRAEVGLSLTVPGSFRPILAADTLIAQWGRVVQLPTSLGGSGSSFKPVYYSETGSLKEITVSNTPVSPEPLGSLNTATGSITDALKARAEAKAPKDNELAETTRQADLLEQKLRIQKLLQELNTGEAP